MRYRMPVCVSFGRMTRDYAHHSLLRIAIFAPAKGFDKADGSAVGNPRASRLDPDAGPGSKRHACVETRLGAVVPPVW